MKLIANRSFAARVLAMTRQRGADIFLAKARASKLMCFYLSSLAVADLCRVIAITLDRWPADRQPHAVCNVFENLGQHGSRALHVPQSACLFKLAYRPFDPRRAELLGTLPPPSP